MYYVYILKSKKNGRLYTGFTNDLKQRFKDHNAGKSSYTKNNRPYVLVYYEAYSSEKDARTRERMLKLRSNASLQLRKRIIESINEG
jgi:putative endonuclease